VYLILKSNKNIAMDNPQETKIKYVYIGSSETIRYAPLV